MADVQRVSATAWEWRVENKGFGVRVFASTRKLIYSSWTDSAEGPRFNNGVAQTFDHFLAGKPPPFDVPQGVLDELYLLSIGNRAK
jgi:hypothetical protein